jgi:hypothetical protein
LIKTAGRVGLISEVDAAMRIVGVGGGTSVDGDDILVVRGELALAGGSVKAAGDRSYWRDEGRVCVGSWVSNRLSLDFSVAAEGRGSSRE